ncbi:diguanylate cyclase (GGDEF domain) [hydrothermal vent metagenome]|uniref:Diguanylate cyclase (GGDEF domain) n=1 Tax=hydrothermal vent metagenome TaxID=652676 RepID=A0A3B1AFA5_9ZZZZ
MPNTENATKDWKRKYFDSLKELESSEQKWEKIESLLRLGISRLTLITDSSDNKNLAEQIALLRKSIRKGTESGRLISLIETISDDIKKLPDDTTKETDKLDISEVSEVSKDSTSEHDGTIALLKSIIDAIVFENNHKSKINEFKKLLETNDEYSNEQLTQKFSLIISGFIKIDEVTPPTVVENSVKQENIETPSTVERRTDNRAANDLDTDIDRSIDAKRNSLVAPAVGELLLQLMTRFPPSFTKSLNDRELARAASSARNRKDLLSIIDNISQQLTQFVRNVSSKNNTDENGSNDTNGELLIELLQRISLPDYLNEQASKLKQDIERADPKNSTSAMVEATADLIMQMRVRLQSEKKELEQFLTEISKHLKALDIDIQITSRLRDDSKLSLQKYDEDLENEVRGLESGADETVEFDDLKEVVKERVKTIRLHMGAFRKSEEQRDSTVQLTINKLNNRIKDMEQETQLLREQVEKEHNSAVRDTLTNIPNRLAYEERIASEIERCKRYKSSMAFVVWDIDHFKGINDHFGHIAGDKVLSVIAEVLRKNLRAADFIARYGGEEFVVIMPETEIDKAQTGCEKIRVAIESCNFHYRDTSVPITASCGYTSYIEGDDSESLFDRADKALYKAKENGRNQCVKS